MNALLALDRATARRFDEDGRLRVTDVNISKATVSPYRGEEVPGWQDRDLDPDRIYQLLRDPKELEKAASTFNALPLLIGHTHVTADDPRPELVVGSTGTNARFDDPYLQADLVIRSADAIDLIESGERRELSCAYRFEADMTPGTFRGEPFDGVMKNLRGSHVALVSKGRAGPDVVVADEALRPFTNGDTMALSQRLVRGGDPRTIQAAVRELQEADHATSGILSAQERLACDSAGAIYGAALRRMGVSTAGKHPIALKQIFQAYRQKGRSSAVAMDEAAERDFAKRFPHAARINISSPGRAW